MVGLTDIAPVTATVTVHGQAIAVRGLSAADIAQILTRFPEVGSLASGGEIRIDFDTVLRLAPRALAAAIAAGCGHAGDEAAEKAAAALELELQADLFEAITRLTAPSGVVPFVRRVAAAINGVGRGASGKAPSTSSRQPSKS